MRLTTLVEARIELDEAFAWYAARSATAAAGFVAEFQTALSEIGSRPEGFSLLESHEGPEDFRRYVMKRYPYHIVYECLDDVILIVAVAHDRRRPGYWMGRIRGDDSEASTE